MVSQTEANLLQNALALVADYSKPAYRRRIDRIFRVGTKTPARPLLVYVHLLTSYSPIFKNLYLGLKDHPDGIQEFLQECYKNTEFTRLNKLSQDKLMLQSTDPHLSPAEAEAIKQLDHTPESPQKTETYRQLTESIIKKETQTTSPEPALIQSIPAQPSPPPVIEPVINTSSISEATIQTPPISTTPTPNPLPPTLSQPTISPQQVVQSISSTVTSPLAQNFGSKVQIFIMKNIGKFATPTNLFRLLPAASMAAVGATFGGPIGALAGGVLGAVGAPALSKSGLAGAAGSKILSTLNKVPGPIGAASRAITIAGKVYKHKKAISYFLIAAIAFPCFFFFVLIYNQINESSALFPVFTVPAEAAPGIPGPTNIPPGGSTGTIGLGCPDTSINTSDATCHYLSPSINIFNTSISQASVDSYTSKYSSTFTSSGKGDLAEFTKRVNYIVTNSQQAGLNPAIFLGYWKTESNFSSAGGRDMGCVGDNFYEQVDCALGINTFSDPAKNPIANCARSKDASSVACRSLKSIRTNFDKSHPVKYPISTFDDFAESYGPYDDLSGGLHTNCTHTYNILIDVAEELNACVISSPTNTISPTPTPLAIPGDIAGLQAQIKSNFNIDFELTSDDLDNNQYKTVLTWADEILNVTSTRAPEFINLIKKNLSNSGKQVTIRGRNSYSERVGDTIYLSTRPGSVLKSDEGFFKQNFIHELTHIINNGQPGTYGPSLQPFINQEGYISSYSAHSTPGEVHAICADGPYQIARQDEDFSESVSYFININVGEYNYSASCGGGGGPNPYAGGNHPAHYNFIKSLLKSP